MRAFSSFHKNLETTFGSFTQSQIDLLALISRESVSLEVAVLQQHEWA